ncbi:MAG: peptide chain release factor-like protein [Methanosarcinaceae archaeon]|nr:peptide chain release factor-like protein [Methanosarcinaceae archaeon]
MIEKKKMADNINIMADNVSVLFGKISGKDKLEIQIDKLQARILELEIDVKRLETQLEKNKVNTREAVAAKQEAEEKLNVANIRMETLVHEVETLKKETEQQVRFREIEVISPLNMNDYLSQIRSLRSAHETLITAYVAAGRSVLDLGNPAGMLEHIDEKSRILLDRIDSSTGFVLFYDTLHMVCEVITPQLPVTTSMWRFGNVFEADQLEVIANRELRVCILVVHAGESFVGIASNKNEFESQQVIRSSVKAKHTKGGFSQRRFERLRDEDIAHHMKKIQDTFKNILKDNTNGIDYIITAGDQQLARHVMKVLQQDIPVIEKRFETKIEKHNTGAILKNALSSHRYRF